MLRLFQHPLPVHSIQDKALNKVCNYSSATVTRLFPSYLLFFHVSRTYSKRREKGMVGESGVPSRFPTGTSEVQEIHLPWEKLTLDLQIFLTGVLGKHTART